MKCDEIKMSDTSSTVGMLMGGLLLGALVGAVTALLVTPQSGLQTRMMIMDKGSDVKDRIVSGAGETKVKAQQAVVGLRDRAGKWARGMRRRNSGYEEGDLEIINPEIPTEGAGL